MEWIAILILIFILKLREYFKKRNENLISKFEEQLKLYNEIYRYSILFQDEKVVVEEDNRIIIDDSNKIV